MIRQCYHGIRAIGNFLQSPLLLIIRLYWGYQFAITGWGKFLHLDKTIVFFQSLDIPLPAVNAVLAGSAELVGGVLLFLGLFSRVAAIPLIATMITALLTASHESLVTLFTQYDPDSFFSQTPFLFLYASVIIFCFGPGKFSLDYWVTDEYRKDQG